MSYICIQRDKIPVTGKQVPKERQTAFRLSDKLIEQLQGSKLREGHLKMKNERLQ